MAARSSLRPYRPVARVTKALTLLTAGFVLGDVALRRRRTQRERLARQSHEVLRRRAVEVNDTLVQGMAAAKWSLESGSVEAGLRTLDTTLRTGEQLVSDLIRLSERPADTA